MVAILTLFIPKTADRRNCNPAYPASAIRTTMSRPVTVTTSS
jgi:hypothetical protein